MSFNFVYAQIGDIDPSQIRGLDWRHACRLVRVFAHCCEAVPIILLTNCFCRWRSLGSHNAQWSDAGYSPPLGLKLPRSLDLGDCRGAPQANVIGLGVQIG